MSQVEAAKAEEEQEDESWDIQDHPDYDMFEAHWEELESLIDNFHRDAENGEWGTLDATLDLIIKVAKAAKTVAKDWRDVKFENPQEAAKA